MSDIIKGNNGSADLLRRSDDERKRGRITMGLYNDTVMDHFMHPRNVGEIPDADGTGIYGSPACGDMMQVQIKVDENDIITDCKFKTFGCGSAIASSSMATTMVIGTSVEDALNITNKAIVDKLGGLPNIKLHCSVLAEDALKHAIYDYAQKHGKHYKELEGFNPDDHGTAPDDVTHL